MLLRVWESINSYMFDERMLHFISELTEMHTNSDVSNPQRLIEIPDDEKSEGEGRPNWSQNVTADRWQGLYKDVGIFTQHEWNFLMCKCLASMGEHKNHRLTILRLTLLAIRNSACRWRIFNYRSIGRQSSWVWDRKVAQATVAHTCVLFYILFIRVRLTSILFYTN